MKYKLICTDIDGCILEHNKPPSIDEILWFKKYNLLMLKNEVPKIAFMSGRSLEFMLLLSRVFNIKAYLIAENGFLIYDPFLNNTYIIENTKKSLEVIKIRILILEYLYKNFKDFEIEPSRNYTISIRTINKEPATLYINEIKKLIKIFHEKYKINKINVYIGGNVVDIIPLKINKFKGLLYLLKIVKIKLNEIVAFGDSENDLNIIKKIKNTGAPYNASDIIKTNVKYISRYNYFYGFKDFVENYIINDKIEKGMNYE